MANTSNVDNYTMNVDNRTGRGASQASTSKSRRRASELELRVPLGVEVAG
jgi:hypothetical protein